jgi:hypothetical protein
VDSPISLSRGTIAKVDFATNVHAYYIIQIYFPVGAPPDCNEENLRSRRIYSIGKLPVYQVGDGRKTSDAEVTSGPVLGAFESRPGRYSLTIEILSDTACFDECTPHVLIQAAASDVTKWKARDHLIIDFSAILGSLGGLSLIVGFLGKVRQHNS